MTGARQLPLRFHCVLGADAPKTPFHQRGNCPRSWTHELRQTITRNYWKEMIVADERNNCR